MHQIIKIAILLGLCIGIKSQTIFEDEKNNQCNYMYTVDNSDVPTQFTMQNTACITLNNGIGNNKLNGESYSLHAAYRMVKEKVYSSSVCDGAYTEYTHSASYNTFPVTKTYSTIVYGTDYIATKHMEKMYTANNNNPIPTIISSYGLCASPKGPELNRMFSIKNGNFKDVLNNAYVYNSNDNTLNHRVYTTDNFVSISKSTINNNCFEDTTQNISYWVTTTPPNLYKSIVQTKCSPKVYIDVFDSFTESDVKHSKVLAYVGTIAVSVASIMSIVVTWFFENKKTYIS